MAPESLHGARDADARTDVWALGVMLFELLAGRRPFLATGPSIFVVIATTDAPRLADVAPDVDHEVAEVVDQCLRRSVTERFSSAAELATALAAALQSASVRVPTVSVEPMAELQPIVPELDLPRTIGGSDATSVDLHPPSVESTLPSRIAPSQPDRTEVMAGRPYAAPSSARVAEAAPVAASIAPPRRRTGSGLELEETPRSSRHPSSARWSIPSAAMAPPPEPRARAEGLSWLTSLLVLGITALALTGALTAATGQAVSFAVVRPFVETSPPIAMALQAGAALVAAAAAAWTFRGGMRQWRAGSALTALVYAGASGGLLFAALRLLRAAW